MNRLLDLACHSLMPIGQRIAIVERVDEFLDADLGGLGPLAAGERGDLDRAAKLQQEAVRARMTAAGIEPAMEQDHGWCHSLYYLDPNGIMVELCRDTPGFTPDPDEAHRLLGIDPLVEQSRDPATAIDA